MINKVQSVVTGSLRLIVVVATFVLVGILSGQTASVSADTPQLQGSISFTATNKQGNKQTIGESKASDGATYANPAQVYYNTPCL
ncbi:hypothetical protein [Lentilactobacillus kefiri]|uniref:hypothetical protein n=1 Tax=Lentilactobacillus kefiri TaxID=33962 RepID=UPI00345E12DA